MKFVKNVCYGGFSVSRAIYDELDIKWDDYGYIDNLMLGIKSSNMYAYRSDPRLIAAIEKIGVKDSAGDYAKLEIVDVPVDDALNVDFNEYGGFETISLSTFPEW